MAVADALGEGLFGSVTSDFGRLVEGMATGQVRPATTEEVVAAVAAARDSGEPVTIRASAHSFGGQAVPDRSRVFDVTRLDAVRVEDATALCGPGATLRQVVEATLPHGLLLPTLTNLLDLTVGGLLSVGGIGPASQAAGPLVANVSGLTVVTPDAALVTCSRTKRRDLFEAVLCGLGQHGVIVEAHLELRPMSPRIRTFHLLYDDHRSWLEDQMKLAGTVTAMEGACAPVPLGLRGTGGVRKPYATWLFPLQLAVEHDDVPPDLPAGLAPYRVLHVEDDETRFFPTRHDARFAGMKRLGEWDLPHPTVSALIDPEALLDLLPQILAAIPPTIGEAYRQVAMVDTRGAPALFPSAGQSLIAFFNVMHAGAPPPLLEAAMAGVEQVRNLAVEAGASTYAPDWLGSPGQATPDGISARVAAKQAHDPGRLFCSLLLPAARGPRTQVTRRIPEPRGRP
jgi:cytokinin dehydrogenase